MTGVRYREDECNHVGGRKFSDLCLCKIIVRKEVCAEEQLDRFLDNIRGNAAVNLLQSLAGLFIGLVIHGLRRLRSVAWRDFIGRSHPLRMISGILDVSEPLFLGTFLKVDGYVSWRDAGRSLGLIRPRCAWWSFLLTMRCGVVGGECCEWLGRRVIRIIVAG